MNINNDVVRVRMTAEMIDSFCGVLVLNEIIRNDIFRTSKVRFFPFAGNYPFDNWILTFI